jgi:hypothetical protein
MDGFQEEKQMKKERDILNLTSSEYREKVFEDKKQWRLEQAQLPFEEKIETLKRLLRIAREFRSLREEVKS